MLIIDGDHIFVYRIGFAIEKDPSGMAAAEHNIRAAIGHMINATQDFNYKIFLTGKDNFRTEVATLLPYKGNRKLARKPKYYSKIREYLHNHYKAVIVDGMEADDAMGIEQMKYYHTPEHLGDTGYCASTIVACDKDMDMIPGNHYNPVKHISYWIDEVEAMRNYYKQILTGDSCDNIPGLKGMGPKGASKILDKIDDPEEMWKEVYDTYYKAAKLLKGHESTYELKLKGITKFLSSQTDVMNILSEIKQLLWIRRYETV